MSYRHQHLYGRYGRPPVREQLRNFSPANFAESAHRPYYQEERERRSSFSLPESPHPHQPMIFPDREPYPLGHGDGYEFECGPIGDGVALDERFYEHERHEPDVHISEQAYFQDFHRDTFHDAGPLPPPAMDYCDPHPTQPQEHFPSDRGPAQWGTSEFPPREHRTPKPVPLMSVGTSSDLPEYDNHEGVRSTGWRNENLRRGSFDTRLQRSRDEDQYRHQTECYSSNEVVFTGEDTDFSDPSGRTGQYGHLSSGQRDGNYSEGSGQDLLGRSRRNLHCEEPSGGHGYGQRSTSMDDSVRNFEEERPARFRERYPSSEAPLRGKRSRRGRGKGSRGRKQRRNSSPGQANARDTRGRGGSRAKHRPSVAQSSHFKERTLESRRDNLKVTGRSVGRGLPPKAGNTAAVLQRRPLHESSLGVEGKVTIRSPSPKTIQERLGPHIPGSGSVQNRLGPPTEAAGIHSRLGPEEKPLSSSGVHARLGPEDTNCNPLSLGEPGDTFNDSLPSDHVHSLLRPEESYGTTFLSEDDLQSCRGTDENLISSLATDSVYARLGPKDDVSMERVHLRLGPEVSSPIPPLLHSDPLLSSDSRLEFSDNSFKPIHLDGEAHHQQSFASQTESQGKSSLDITDHPSQLVTSNDSYQPLPHIDSFLSTDHVTLHNDDGITHRLSPMSLCSDDASSLQRHSLSPFGGYGAASHKGTETSGSVTLSSFSHKSNDDFPQDVGVGDSVTASSAQDLKSHSSTPVGRSGIDTRCGDQTKSSKHDVSPSQRKRITSRPSSSTRSPTTASKTRRKSQSDSHNKRSLVTSPAAAPQSVVVGGGKCLEKEASTKTVKSTSSVVGQAIPTLLQRKSVPPVKSSKPVTPAAKVNSATKPETQLRSGKPEYKTDNLVHSVSAPYNASVAVMGVDVGVTCCDKQKHYKCKVGVASALPFEKELEEGEVTDSEGEDLVIDLDRSTSTTASQVNPILQKSPGQDSKVQTKVEIKPLGVGNTVKETEPLVPKGTKAVGGDNDDNKAVAMEITADDDTQFNAMAKSTQQVDPDTCRMDVSHEIKTWSSCLDRTGPFSADNPTSAVRGKLARKASAVLGAMLAGTLNGARLGSRGASILSVMRSISAKQIDLLKIIFLRPISGRKPLGINVDVFIAYWQMKIPECVVGGASVIELAKLVSLDSNDFYHCDLRSLLHHCGNDMAKWRVACEKYTYGMRAFMTLSRMKLFFPKSVYNTTGELVSSSVRANIPPTPKKPLCRDVAVSPSSLTFLEVATMKYGPSFVKALHKVDVNIKNGCKKGIKSCVLFDGSGVISKLTPPMSESMPSLSSSVPCSSTKTQLEWSSSAPDFDVSQPLKHLPIPSPCSGSDSNQPMALAGLFNSNSLTSTSVYPNSATSTVSIDDNSANITTVPIACTPVGHTLVSESTDSNTATVVTQSTTSDHPPSEVSHLKSNSTGANALDSALESTSLSHSVPAVEIAVVEAPKPMVTALQPQTTECVVKISSPVEIQHENESKPASSATSSMEVATDSKVITALEIGGAKSEPKLDLLRSDIDVEDVSEEAGSASSGEIVSSAPSSPTEKSCEDEKFSLERHSDASSRDRWRDLSSSDLRSQRYPPSPPSHHRVIPRAYSYRKRRSSPDGGRWKQNERRRRDNFRRRSPSCSPPPLCRRERPFKRSRRRYSSPEEDSGRLRRRRRSTLSPDVDRHKARENLRRRSTTDGGRDGGREIGGGRMRRKVRSSRSCDRRSDTVASSDEDLEVLELRKEAIMSMLTDRDSQKSTATSVKKEMEGDQKPKDPVTGCYCIDTGDHSEGLLEVLSSDDRGRKQDSEAAMEVTDKSGPEVSQESKRAEEGVVDGVTLSQHTSSSGSEFDKTVTATAGNEVVGEKEGSNSEKNTALSQLKEHTSEEQSTTVEKGKSVSLERDDFKKSESPPPHQSSPAQQPTSTSLTASSDDKPAPSKKKAKLAAVVSGSGKGKVSAVLRSGGRKVAKSLKTGGSKSKVTKPSSGSSSRLGSPASSHGSPAPPHSGMESSGSGVESGGTSQRGSDTISTRQSSSVKVLPGSKVTWEIPAFHIQVASESEDDDKQNSESEWEPGETGVKSPHRPPTMDEIDSVLGQFRRDAEARAKTKETDTIVPAPSPPLPKGQSLQSSPEISRIEPKTLGVLPLKLQKEYLELKTKLVLHAKKQRQGEITGNGRDKGKQPLNATVSKKKVVRSERVKLVLPLLSISDPNVVENVPSTQSMDEVNVSEIERHEDQRMEAQEQQQQKEREEKKKREEESQRKEEKWQKKKKEHEMKIAELEGKIRSCRSQAEKWTHTLSSVTHSLSECESEMEEHELKIELLLKQLELGKSSRDQCQQQRTDLEEEVRVAREKIGCHVGIIQKTQCLLINERDLLITLESNHDDGTDMEIVSMEIESDGSKGEGDMEMVTSSEEDAVTGKSSSLFPALVYEAVSDVEGPGSIPGKQLDSGSLGSSLLVKSLAAKSAQQRQSTSKRTRKSSLSVSHAVPDSDAEDSYDGKKGTDVNPPIPLSPPPTLPPPPDLPPTGPSIAGSPFVDPTHIGPPGFLPPDPSPVVLSLPLICPPYPHPPMTKQTHTAPEISAVSDGKQLQLPDPVPLTAIENSITHTLPEEQVGSESAVNNPFISMLKISKVESLSESPVAFSHAKSTFSASHHVMISHEVSCDQQQANSNQESLMPSSAKAEPTLVVSEPVLCPTPCDIVDITAIDTSTTQSLPSSQEQATYKEQPAISSVQNAYTAEKHSENMNSPMSEKVNVEPEKSNVHAVYVDPPEPENAATLPVSRKKVGPGGKKRKDAAKVGKKEDGVLKSRAGDGGRAGKTESKKKLPLVRSGSDTLVVATLRKSRRKSIPKRRVSKTPLSSPTKDTLRSLLTCSRGGSSALVTALQTTLESALSPALANVLSPSRTKTTPHRLCELKRKEDEGRQRLSPLSFKLDKTLQQTLTCALSPVLESVLSPSSYCRLLSRVSRDRKPCDVGSESDVSEHTVKESHDVSHDPAASVVVSHVVVETSSEAMESDGVPSETNKQSFVLGREVKHTVVTGSRVALCSDCNTASFFCGLPEPTLGVLPRAVPNIPFEIKSSGVDVWMLRSLVRARFASTGGPSVTTEQVSETCDMETQEYGCMETETETVTCGLEKSVAKDVLKSTKDLKSKVIKVPEVVDEASSGQLSSTEKMKEVFSSCQVVTTVATSSAATTTPPTDPRTRKPSLDPSKSSVQSSQPGTKPSSTPHSNTAQPKPKSSKKVAASSQTSAGTAVEQTASKKLKPKVKPVPKPSPTSASGTKNTQSLSVERLLGRIKEVKSNLEKQSKSSLGVKVESVTKATRSMATQTQTAACGAVPSSKKPKTAQKPPVTSTKTKKQAVATSSPVVTGQVKGGSVVKKVTNSGESNKQQKPSQQLHTGKPTVESKAEKGNMRLPWEKAGQCQLTAEGEGGGTAKEERRSKGQRSLGVVEMNDVVKELGFEVTWEELRELLQPAHDPLSRGSPLVTCRYGVADMGKPLLASTPQSSSNVVSESVLESVRQHEVVQVAVRGEPVVTKPLSLHRYKPYASPLLFLPSYRLNPHFRTNERLSLSSLSHSNKIDPMKMWCKYEVFGRCSNPQCTWQHVRDIQLSREELIDDITAYSSSLSTDSIKVSNSDGTVKQSRTEDRQPYTQSLRSAYSGKMPDEKLLSLAVHRVGQEGRGVVRAEEVRCREHGTRDDRAGEECEKSTRPPPLYWPVEKEEEADHHKHFTVVPTSTVHDDSSSKMDRYFTISSSPPPPSPTGPAHFLSLARGTKDTNEACIHLETGLSRHPVSEELWMEYLPRKSAVIVASGCRDNQEELLNKGLSSCPIPSVAMKCVELAVDTVADKERWIKKAYSAITHQSQPSPSLSLCRVELLLSHTYLYCLSGRLDEAVTNFRIALETDEKSSEESTHLFAGVAAHLSLPHLQLAYLTLLHLLCTSSFPSDIVLSSHQAPIIPLRLNHNVDPLLLPWSQKHSLSSDKLEKIEQLLAVAITRCQYQDPSNSMEMTFALYHNLILFQLTHRSQEIAHQTLSGLLNCSPHSTQLWMLATRFQDWTSSSATALDVIRKATEAERDATVSKLCFYATKLVLKQGSDGCGGDTLAAMLPWLQKCVCQFYDVSESDRQQFSVPDIVLLYRKLLGQLIPYNHATPDVIGREKAREDLPYLWVTYCHLVQVSHHTLRGSYYHSDPEEAFESAVHSVNRLSHLRIVWLEYLSYLRDNALNAKSSHSAFNAFSDCVFRCLVVMDAKQATPTSILGQPMHYFDYTFQEQVCNLYFSSLPSSSPFILDSLVKLVKRFSDNPHLISRLSLHCLHHSPSSLDQAQTALATFLSHNPKCLPLWRLAVRVELAQNNTREARWMFREAVKHVPLSADLWKEFLLFELRELATNTQLSVSSSSSKLAHDVVTQANQVGVVLTQTTPPTHPLLPAAHISSTTHTSNLHS